MLPKAKLEQQQKGERRAIIISILSCIVMCATMSNLASAVAVSDAAAAEVLGGVSINNNNNSGPQAATRLRVNHLLTDNNDTEEVGGDSGGDSNGGGGGVNGFSNSGSSSFKGSAGSSVTLEAGGLGARFSWSLSHSKRAQSQTSFRIVIEALLHGESPLHYDTGRVNSTQAIYMYAGPPMHSGRVYRWRIEWWDADQHLAPPSRWSQITSSPSPAQWSASEWLNSSQLRADFTVTVNDNNSGGDGDDLVNNNNNDKKSPTTTTTTTTFSSSFSPAPAAAAASTKFFPSSSSNVVKATAFVASAGLFQLFVNGVRANPKDALAGAWTDYDQRVLYYTYDISSLIKDNALNALGVTLGQGWRDPSVFQPKKNATECDATMSHLIRVLVLDAGGNVLLATTSSTTTTTTTTTVKANSSSNDSDIVSGISSSETDNNNNNNNSDRYTPKKSKWTSNPAPAVINASIYNGEVFDARLEANAKGWALPGFTPKDGSTWPEATPAKCYKPSKLTPLDIPRIGVEEVNPPVSVTRVGDSDFVVDFGHNLAGWARIRVKGDRGTTISLRHAEVLMHEPYGPRNGSVYQGNLRTALATDTYTLAGTGAVETFEPHFTCK